MTADEGQSNVLECVPIGMFSSRWVRSSAGDLAVGQLALWRHWAAFRPVKMGHAMYISMTSLCACVSRVFGRAYLWRDTNWWRQRLQRDIQTDVLGVEAIYPNLWCIVIAGASLSEFWSGTAAKGGCNCYYVECFKIMNNMITPEGATERNRTYQLSLAVLLVVVAVETNEWLAREPTRRPE